MTWIGSWSESATEPHVGLVDGTGDEDCTRAARSGAPTELVCQVLHSTTEMIKLITSPNSMRQIDYFAMILPGLKLRPGSIEVRRPSIM
jgi:hypothetical protein